MIEKYYQFNVDKFFEEYSYNVRKLKELKAEKESALTNDGMDYGRIKGSGISDPVARMAQRREKIDLQIREYEEYFKAYDTILAEMDDDEKKLIEYLKLPEKKKGKTKRAFHDLEDYFFADNSTIYRKLADLKKKIRRMADW